jgi:hypothetical protein
MTKRDFINRVLLIMNEAGMFDAAGNSYLGADTTQVDRHIEGSYVDAWRRCAKVMPRAWFHNEPLMSADGVSITPDLPNGTGYIVLPADFYLLTALKMKGWQKAVYEAAVENEKTASIQSNEWTRGSTIRPVCTISNKLISDANEIKQVLNYYSLSKGLTEHRVEESIYVPVCKPISGEDDDYQMKLSEQIIEPLAYLSASTVFTMFEKYEIAGALEARAVEMFPGLSKMKGANITIQQ